MRTLFFPLSIVLLTAGCPSPVTLLPVDNAAPPTRVNAIIDVDSGNADPEMMDFGQVAAGSTQDATLLIRNIGTDTLAIQDLTLTSPSFQLVNLDELGSPLLAPDSAWELTVRYTPFQDETVLATLMVASNDRLRPEVPVSLRAEGLAPALDLDPDSFDFGNRELGCVGSLPVSIANVGRAPLVLDDILFDDLSGNGEMNVQLPPSYQPGYTINPGDPPLTVEVFYSPSDVLPDTGSLTVLSNDPLQPEASASQFGIAHLGDNQVDSFAQEGDNATDILFVVDNSCSMGEEQAALATNFATFGQIITALDVQYQIGVVTTDLTDNGVLQGTTPIITPNTPDPAGAFAANVNLGNGGSASEKAFDAAYLALSSPNIDPGGPNQGFLRDNAGLHIVMVTDEPNQSTLLPGGPLSYVSWLRGLKANPDHVVISDITGGLTGCTGASGTASAGTDFMLATNATGGVSGLICDSDWASILAAIGWASQSQADTFELSRTPVPETIEVRLSTDGINFAPVYVGWAFDAALNAVLFDADHVPDNGDFIDIGYAVLGDCDD